MNKGLLLALVAALTFSPIAEVGFSANAAVASPQKVSIKGTIVDEANIPVIGATILVAGHSELGGAVTDANGEFTFSVPEGMNITVSCIGYDPLTVTIGTQRVLTLTLKEQKNLLDEVVVVGYGTQTKESIVGSISTVSGDDVANTGAINLTNALNGKVAGMSQIVSSGAPGEDDAVLMLRGLSSWNGSSPLVLVDGIERSMSDISPNDVQNISVLKDASATAVFGSKGANGVILITTKTGLKGRPKMHVSADFGVKSVLNMPNHISSATTVEMANNALKNGNSFGSLYSDAVIQAYRDQSDPYRYPDVDWYKEMFNTFAPTYKANFDIKGGSDKVRYFASVNYVHEGSILKNLTDAGSKQNYKVDRFNYRLNLDADITKTTTLSLKLGGISTITTAPLNSAGTQVNTGEIFSTQYQATGAIFPAYFPADIYEQYPDPNYPDASGIRLASSAGANFSNPMRFLLYSQWEQTTQHRINTDLVLNQKLDFITKGLSAKVTASLTTAYSRVSETATHTVPEWSIDWQRYDLGVADIWNSNLSDASSVYVETPYAVTQSTGATGVAYIFYLEGGLDYKRSFGKHNVTATTLYSQRQYTSAASSPKRNQSVVGRITYNYAKKYLLEFNAGVTGSEQFAPKYRYGFFPSAAIGYVVSNEKFWKRAMPWWSTMKLRYSDGLVGSDSANSNFLYYTSYSSVKYAAANNHYIEDKVANEGARWETAHKRDIGIEMGWFKNDLTLNVDLYDEYRYDMLVTPVITPLLGVKFKDTNSGSIKKHGIDIELAYRHIWANGFSFSVSGLFGINENRIVDYPDITYAPQYQKYAGTPVKSEHKGSTLIDDKYFQTINEIHGYSTYTTNWSSLVPGVYKFLDYLPDGQINDNDLHALIGSQYPPCTYSVNVQLGYKGFTFRVVGAGTKGKYVNFRRGYQIPFLAKDLIVHTAQLDYWSPTNRNASCPVLLYDDSMYSWGGGTSASPGYDLALEGYTWRNSDYFDISELYVAYKFSPKRKSSNFDGITLSLTCNNLYLFTNLIEGNPMATDFYATRYPLMRTTTLGLSVNF